MRLLEVDPGCVSASEPVCTPVVGKETLASASPEGRGVISLLIVMVMYVSVAASFAPFSQDRYCRE
jgi:hypothetical protein